jgi:ectoine hydroxylase-related dioxygenase (phytanoyl-CoA dioxygenase family)
MTKPHPWSTNYTWEDHKGPFRVLTDAQVARFDREGFCLVEDAIDKDTIAKARAEIDAFEEKTEAKLREQKNERVAISEAGAITFTTHLVTRSAFLKELASSEVMAGIAKDLIGPDVRLYWDQAVYKKPEKPRRFPWHQDNGYAFVEPQAYVTCWTPLVDATVENGCPQVVPKLHRQGTLEHLYVHPLGFECLSEHPDAMPVEAKAGSIVVFSSLTPHLTGPNTTDHVRKAYILQYAPDGAVKLEGDPNEGPATNRVPQNDPDRQFRV